MNAPVHALIVSVGKNVAWVVLDGETEPRLAALRRMSGKRSMPVPGDEATVKMLEDGTTVVEHLLPRRFALTRRSVGGREKTMAANVDTLVTVTALASPPPRLVTLDQLLAFAALENIAATVVFTKPDLADASQRAGLERTYEAIGYPVVTIDPKHGDNLDALRAALAGKHALLCGNSGVGKSSIFRVLGGEATIGETSRHGLGRQTTTTARLYRMADGFLIDSPGVNEFGLGAIGPRDLAHGFVEMREPTTRCRFTDCTHLREPGCGVREAVARGAIAASRYASFEQIAQEA
ncbi:MAG TPA: ribosome small subunit-dependent GTPase A [Candidatus Baltobacteraceae bacterium]